jgi:hypothetical protein
VVECQQQGENLTLAGRGPQADDVFQTLRPQLATFNVTNGSMTDLKVIQPIAWGFNIPGQNVIVRNHYVHAKPDNGTRGDTHSFPFNTDGFNLSGESSLCRNGGLLFDCSQVVISRSTAIRVGMGMQTSYAISPIMIVSNHPPETIVYLSLMGHATSPPRTAFAASPPMACPLVLSVKAEPTPLWRMLPSITGPWMEPCMGLGFVVHQQSYFNSEQHLQFKSWTGGNGYAKNVTWSDIKLVNVSTAIYITQKCGLLYLIAQTSLTALSHSYYDQDFGKPANATNTSTHVEHFRFNNFSGFLQGNWTDGTW